MSVVRTGGSSRCMPVSRVDRLCQVRASSMGDEPWTKIRHTWHSIRAKRHLAVAIAVSRRRREVRFFGTISRRPEAVRRLVGKVARQHRQLTFCYEAGPTGYGRYRQIRALEYDCRMVALSMVPVRPGGHINRPSRRDHLGSAIPRRLKPTILQCCIMEPASIRDWVKWSLHLICLKRCIR